MSEPPCARKKASGGLPHYRRTGREGRWKLERLLLAPDLQPSCSFGWSVSTDAGVLFASAPFGADPGAVHAFAVGD